MKANKCEISLQYNRNRLNFTKHWEKKAQYANIGKLRTDMTNSSA